MGCGVGCSEGWQRPSVGARLTAGVVLLVLWARTRGQGGQRSAGADGARGDGGAGGAPLELVGRADVLVLVLVLAGWRRRWKASGRCSPAAGGPAACWPPQRASPLAIRSPTPEHLSPTSPDTPLRSSSQASPSALRCHWPRRRARRARRIFSWPSLHGDVAGGRPRPAPPDAPAHCAAYAQPQP